MGNTLSEKDTAVGIYLAADDSYHSIQKVTISGNVLSGGSQSYIACATGDGTASISEVIVNGNNCSSDTAVLATPLHGVAQQLPAPGWAQTGSVPPVRASNGPWLTAPIVGGTQPPPWQAPGFYFFNCQEMTVVNNR